MPNRFAEHWGLNPEIDFLNHGSFGATPTEILQVQRRWQDALESDPIEFLAPERSLLPKIDYVRSRVGDWVGADAADVVMVRNATEGVNAVVQSFPFKAGDEVVITNHGYNACNNAVRYAASRQGAQVVVADVPFPLTGTTTVLDAIEAVLTPRTRLVVIDHVTSPTGLLFPIADVCRRCQSRGIRVLVDGAHAPGMVPVDLASIQPDYYTANHHKWLCAPKTSGFLYVNRPWQSEVRPTTISHGANTDRYGATRFQAEFNWVGTFDPSPILSVPAAIDFLGALLPGGWRELMAHNHDLAVAGRRVLTQRLGLQEPAPEAMLGSLAAIIVPATAHRSQAELESLKLALYHEDRIEVPIFSLRPGIACLRISAQIYNNLDQYSRLADALQRRLIASGY